MIKKFFDKTQRSSHKHILKRLLILKTKGNNFIFFVRHLVNSNATLFTITAVHIYLPLLIIKYFDLIKVKLKN